MLHDIGDEVYRCEYNLIRPADYDNDYIIVMDSEQMLLIGEPVRIPRICELLPPEKAGPEKLQYLFSISGRGFYLYSDSIEATEEAKYYTVNALRPVKPQWMAFAGVTAYHIAYWYGRNRFCGRCGKPFRHHDKERALVCPECGNVRYPDMSVATIIGVIWGNKLLLTKYVGRSHRNYALVAGFNEIGEPLQATVRREVFEETGVNVKNIRYFDNQPWGFSRSLLVGFFAELDGPPEITLQEDELAVAEWVDREDVPCYNDISLTAKMMAAFHNGEIK